MPKTEVIKRPKGQFGEQIKKTAWGAVFESLITIIFGVLLIVWPDVVVKIITYAVGVFFVIKGAYQVINYFVVKGQNNFFDNTLLAGVVSILVGLTLLLIGEEIANIFRIVIGIWMIYESLIRINTSIKLHAANISVWKYTLILALMMLVAGVFITFYSGAVITLIGWIMVLTGIIGVISDVMFIQHVNLIIETIANKLNKS